MAVFLLNWKEGVFFAAFVIFLFTPWGRGLRRYCLLGLFIYLLNKPLIADFHPGNITWWIKDPAAWITVATWVGGVMISFHWLKGKKNKGVWNALSEVRWQSHLIALSLIILALFLFNLSKISPQFKTQADFSFPLVIVNASLQYWIGLFCLKSVGKTVKHPIPHIFGGL